ncbi:MAG: Nif3-like dinuclear metal center hexameric protein [Chitinispirillaceae bacterium]|nr:Nif3-like dinuclear metal center hexameric protein [Chitinispirillaceae bacterium]
MNRKQRQSGQGSVDRNSVCEFLARTLNLAAVNDHSCNGLQVQGAARVRRIGLAVDACLETFRRASERSCGMLIVHHGIIWGGLTTITGPVYTQVRYLIDHDLNLFAAHLPLDLHPTLGNNAQLARLLGLKGIRPFGLYKGVAIGCEGTARPGTSRDGLVDTLCRRLDTACTVLPFGEEAVRRIAVVSGGGAGELAEAVGKGIDCFITGEPSHENYHAALEAKINVIYAGHYHTEKAGVAAIGKLLEKKFGIETMFLDVPTAI